MGFLFREHKEFERLYESIFHKEAPLVKRGDYCIINISEHLKLTKFLLNGKQNTLSPKKSRPIIILLVDLDKELVKFVATTTDESVLERRPKISTEGCNIKHDDGECDGFNLKRKYAWLFAKLTKKAKRWRFFYEIKIQDLRYLYENGKFKVCGTCNEGVIEEILQRIEEFGEYV